MTNDFIDKYKSLDREALLRLLVEKDDEIHLSKVFMETLSNQEQEQDTNLQWKGRHRFLNEKVRPVRLKIDEKKSFRPTGVDNLIIDGDNLPVMYSLLKDYRGKIDVIYMDPPYNTGEDSFPYNDNFFVAQSEVKKKIRELGRSAEIVSLDDPNRHTKWVNHIAPRLYVAKKLLAPWGVIVISIDEHELPRLWLLMEELFDAKNRIATLVWERSRKNDSKYISEGHEYILVWARNTSELDLLVSQKGKWRETKPGFDLFMDEFNRLKESYGKSYDCISNELKSFVRGIKKGHPLWTIRQYTGVDFRCEELGPFKEEDPSWPGGGGPDYEIIHPETGIAVRTPPKGWIIPDAATFYELDRDQRVIWKGQGTPKIKKYLLEGRDKDVMTSVINKEARQAVMLSKAIFGFEDAYKHPKDHEVLHKLFNLITWRNKNAIILDPYAGSGTTAHAVVTMNAEDNGKRRFILVEGGYVGKNSNISSKEYTNKITAERVRRVISGKWADGKKHPGYTEGFTYMLADDKGITKSDILGADRETLADIILQVAEEESNRIDCRIKRHQYLIGKTRSGLGIGLVWQPGKNGQILTLETLKIIAKEAEQEKCTRPLQIYASANAAPDADDVYRFHQIPDAILTKLGIYGLDDEEEEE